MIELVKSGERIRESEVKFRAVIDQSFQFIGLMNTDGTLIEANRSALAFPGISESDVINQPFWETPWWSHSKELQKKLKNAIQRAASGETVRFEATHIAADGHLAYIDFSVKPVVDPAGKILYLNPEGRDISERKQVEEALHQANIVVENSPVMLFRWEAKESWPVAYVSRNVSPVRLYTEEFISGAVPYAAIVHPDDLERVAHEVQKYSSEGPDRYEQVYRIITKQGKVRWVDDHTVIERNATGAITHYQGIIIDITEQKQPENALIERERDYRGVIENLQDVFYRADAVGNITMASQSVVDLFGYASVEEVIGLNLGRDIFADPDDRKRFLSAISPTGSVRNFEAVLKKKDGSPIIVSISAHYYRDKNGVVLGVEGIAKDITEWKHAQQALVESEEKYRTLVEKSQDGIVVVQNERIAFVNKAFIDMIGFSGQELLGHSVDQFVAPEDAGLVLARHRKRMSGKDVVSSYQYSLLHKDGSTRVQVMMNAGVATFRGRPAMIATFHDVTEERKREAALRESEEKCRTILDTTSEWIWDLDLHGCHTYSNPAVESLLGYTRDEILGISTFDMIHPDDRDRIEQIFVSSVSKKSGWRNVRIRWRHKDGTYRFLESNAAVIFNERGELSRLPGCRP